MVTVKLEEVMKSLELCKGDASKVERGNRTAATRLRKDLGAAMKLLKELRGLALESVKAAKESKAE